MDWVTLARTQRWLAGRSGAAETEERHEKQRGRRAGWHTTHGDGSVEIHARFDKTTGEYVLAAWRRRTDQLWHNDGGRNGTPDDIRAHTQRRADALAELIGKQASDTPVRPKHQVHLVWNLDEPHPH